jgi:WD40 repeat protein
MQFASQQVLYEFLVREPNFDLLNLLKEDKLSQIENYFRKRPQGLKLEEFIYIIFKYFEFDYSEKKLKELLCMKLIELFKEIDINDDHSLEWSEFSNHIIQLSSVNRNNTERDNILPFKPSESKIKVKFSKTADTNIEKMLYYPKKSTLFLVEQNSPKFMIFNINDLSNPWNFKEKSSDWSLLYEQVAHKKPITNIELFNDPKDNSLTLATCSVDLSINFWNLESAPKLKNTIFVPEITQVMKFYQESPTSSSLLFTGGNDASIRIYDMCNFKDKASLPCWNPFVKLDNKQRGHSGPISDLLNIKEHSMLASSGLDGRICLWDINKEKFLKFLNNDNKLKSISSLAWIKDLSTLLSGGIDHEIHVYNTYVTEKIYSIKGHTNPISQVKWLEDSYEVFSADVAGIVKIWDYRNWQCLQTFSLSKGITSIQVGATSKNKKRFFVGGKNLYSFVTDEPKNEMLTDENIAVEILYNPEFKFVITVHGSLIKVWNIRTGKLTNIHKNLLADDICSFCFDNRLRKFFISGYKGTLKAFNLQTGAFIKDYTDDKPGVLITKLIYCTSQNQNNQLMQYLICGYDNGTIQFIEDNSQGSYNKVLCEIKFHKRRITNLKIFKESEEFGNFLISMCEDNSIVFTKIDRCRLDTIIYVDRPNFTLLNGIVCMNQYLMVSSDDSYIRFIAKANDKKYQIVKELNLTSFFPDQKKDLLISCMNKIDNFIIAGNNFGDIFIFDIRIIIELAKNPILHTSSIIPTTQIEQIIDHHLDGFDSNVVNTDKDKLNPVKLVIKNHHDDKIFKIEIIEEENVFITTSHDCKTILWRLHHESLSDPVENNNPSQMKFFQFGDKTVEKIGELRISRENDWKFKIQDNQRNDNKLKEVVEILDIIPSFNFNLVEPQKENQPSIKYEVIKKAQIGLSNFKDISKTKNKKY